MTDGDQSPQAEDLGTMTFGEHLDELRRRMLVSVIAVVVVMLFFLLQKKTVMSFVFGPYDRMWQEQAELWRAEQLKTTPAELAKVPAHLLAERQFLLDNWDKIVTQEKIPGVDLELIARGQGFRLPRRLVTFTPLQDIVTFMIAAILCGIAVSSPLLLHQMWRFIGAGLYKNERRTVMMFLPTSILLFGAGMTFGYIVMVPNALFFLYGLADADFLLGVREYFRFLFLLTIALGCVFQLPVIMVALTKVGITTPQTFTKYWRQFILAIFIIGALFTPPDPITQIMMAVPMVGLYLIGIVLAKLVYRNKLKAEAGAETEQDAS
jgi:sec-independent protein translocase protein TatC